MKPMQAESLGGKKYYLSMLMTTQDIPGLSSFVKNPIPSVYLKVYVSIYVVKLKKKLVRSFVFVVIMAGNVRNQTFLSYVPLKE